MKNEIERHPPRWSGSGFSLVVTLTLLLLLSMIAVGMLSLATVAMRSGKRSSAMEEARSNARLALALAIGQLQKHAGPDRRVTAESAFGAGAVTPDDPGRIRHPHWVGVWSTVGRDGAPYIRRDGESGGLSDLREVDGWEAFDEMETQLVSGNEHELKHRADRETEGAELEVVVGAGSLGEAGSDEDFVRVPKVRIGPSSDPEGEYAWWVGDLGTRANLATQDRFEGGDEIRRLQIAQDQSATAIDGAGEIDNPVRRKLATPASLELDDRVGGLIRGHFHDFTTHSESVLVDVREGGLKKDLTAYLEGGGPVPDLEGAAGLAALGIADDDNLVGPANARAAEAMVDGDQAWRLEEISPSFGLVRHWAQRAGQLGLSTTKTEVSQPATRAHSDEIASYGDQNLYPVEYKNRVTTDVRPVLVEGAIYYNLSYYETGSEQEGLKLGLRVHLYPRVVLWNPYNISLRVDPSMLGLQINGSKQVQITLETGETQTARMSWGNLKGPGGDFQRWRRGSHYFKLSGVTLEPGESVVFSPDGNRPYDQSNFAANLLTPDQRPDPSRGFFVDRRLDGDALFEMRKGRADRTTQDDHIKAPAVAWREVVSASAGNVQVSGYTQADDYWMYWKPFRKGGGSGSVDLRDFSALPHGQYVSCAFQYGDEDELPVEWTESDPVPMGLTGPQGVSFQTPDRRTRDGFRLRWFDEHPSNEHGSGSLSGTSHFDTAPIANWNLRASYSFRSAFENVTDLAPHFFGLYTRDLFDDAISWNQLSPRASGSLQRGDPFDQPNAGTPRILFDLPRTGGEVVSLGALQHLKFSECVWHPTYAFGNSLADPRIEPTMTEPDRQLRENTWEGGWNRDTIGYATDGRSNNPTTYNSDSWAMHARSLLEQTAHTQSLFFDLSYELNHSLWDRFFLSTGNDRDKARFLDDPSANPLPNGRLNLTKGAREDDLLDFHRAASTLTLGGGFNVNSTSVDAWESLLLSSAGVRTGADKVLFPRVLQPPGEEWDGSNAAAGDAWSGQRALNRDEVRTLAERIVDQVRLRGPFLGLSDFVNRRLSDDETGSMGALEAALTASGINRAFESRWPLDNSQPLPDYNHIDNIKDPTRIEQTLKPNTNAWGALGHLTQADLLQSLGPVLTARSDTFVIRAYGNSLGPDQEILSEAWCEAVIQRTPEPISPDASGLNPDTDRPNDFGRRFVVKKFRWLSRSEI